MTKKICLITLSILFLIGLGDTFVKADTEIRGNFLSSGTLSPALMIEILDFNEYFELSYLNPSRLSELNLSPSILGKEIFQKLQDIPIEEGQIYPRSGDVTQVFIGEEIYILTRIPKELLKEENIKVLVYSNIKGIDQWQDVVQMQRLVPKDRNDGRFFAKIAVNKTSIFSFTVRYECASNERWASLPFGNGCIVVRNEKIMESNLSESARFIFNKYTERINIMRPFDSIQTNASRKFINFALSFAEEIGRQLSKKNAIFVLEELLNTFPGGFNGQQTLVSPAESQKQVIVKMSKQLSKQLDATIDLSQIVLFHLDGGMVPLGKLKFFLNANEQTSVLEHDIVHETMHFLFEGLGETYLVGLNEAMTEFLALYLLNKDLVSHNEKRYLEEVKALMLLIDKIGINSLIEAYKTGDKAIIEKALGENGKKLLYVFGKSMQSVDRKEIVKTAALILNNCDNKDYMEYLDTQLALISPIAFRSPLRNNAEIDFYDKFSDKENLINDTEGLEDKVFEIFYKQIGLLQRVSPNELLQVQVGLKKKISIRTSNKLISEKKCVQNTQNLFSDTAAIAQSI